MCHPVHISKIERSRGDVCRLEWRSVWGKGGHQLAGSTIGRIAERLPYSDGSGRRRLIAGAFVLSTLVAVAGGTGCEETLDGVLESKCEKAAVRLARNECRALHSESVPTDPAIDERRSELLRCTQRACADVPSVCDKEGGSYNLEELSAHLACMREVMRGSGQDPNHECRTDERVMGPCVEECVNDALKSVQHARRILECEQGR